MRWGPLWPPAWPAAKAIPGATNDHASIGDQTGDHEGLPRVHPTTLAPTELHLLDARLGSMAAHAQIATAAMILLQPQNVEQPEETR
jgi:hypothetical protein